MSESVRVPGSILDPCNRGLAQAETGGNLSLRACRSSRPLRYFFRDSMVQTNVQSVLDRLKMIWVHARLVSTKVMKVNARRDWPVYALVIDAVSLSLSEGSVPRTQHSNPDPARSSESSFADLVGSRFLPRSVPQDVIQRLSLYMSGTPSVHGGERGSLTAAALAQARRVVYRHGPSSVTALKGGGCH
jgi:hypothetical protein